MRPISGVRRGRDDQVGSLSQVIPKILLELFIGPVKVLSQSKGRIFVSGFQMVSVVDRKALCLHHDILLVVLHMQCIWYALH